MSSRRRNNSVLKFYFRGKYIDTQIQCVFFSTLETGYNGTDLLALFPLFFLHCSPAYGSQLSLELSLKLNLYVVTNENFSLGSIPPSGDDFSTVALFMLTTTQNENHPTTYAAIKKSQGKSDVLSSVVHKLANAIHWINLCSVDNESGLHNTCPLGSD